MSCPTCSCSPCRCTTATETSPLECIDPGLTNLAAYAAVLTEDLCPKRLIPFRGLDVDGNQITNTLAPLKPGVMVQKDNGQVQWSDTPIYESPTAIIKVANDADAAALENYIPFTVGKTADFHERRLIGSPDVASGQWKMVWIASIQQWTTVPDITPELPTLCAELLTSFTLDPANTTGYMINLETTEHLSVGVSVMVNGYELVVTEVVDDHFVRVKHMVAPVSPTVINEGEIVCNIGYRPCPQSEAAFADTIPGCKDNAVVSLTVPADISDMKVPGLLWRDQLGHWAFLPAPVDPATGIIDSNKFLGTPKTPVDATANLPSFRGIIPFQAVNPPTRIYQKSVGAVLPTAEVVTLPLSGTAGYIPGAPVAWVSVFMREAVNAGGYETTVKINDQKRGYTWAGIDGKVSTMFNGPFPVPLDATTNIKIALEVLLLVGGTLTSYLAEVYVDGYST